MECPKCKKELQINDRVFMNIETYGNSAVTISECCGSAFNVKRKISFQIDEYKGNKTKDDWGIEIKINK